MRIGIIGTGAMASLFAARLSTTEEVCMVGNWQKQLMAINNHGLKLVQLDGRETTHHFLATNDLDLVGNVDIALILVKGWQTESAAKKTGKILDLNGRAVTLQNGIGNIEKVASEIGDERAVLGVTSEGATIIAAGIVRHAGHGITHMATGSDSSAILRQFAERLEKSGFETHLVDDANSLIWGKLAINAGINPLTGLLQVNNGFLAEDSVARKLMFQAAEETATLARKLGIELPYENAGERALEVAQHTSANRSSMVQDIARGAPTEIESITGAIVTIAAKNNVPTPVNSALLSLVRSLLSEGNWQEAIQRLPVEIKDDFTYLANKVS